MPMSGNQITKLGDLIIEKSNHTEVKGIFENFQAGSKYSEYNKMSKLDVRLG